MKNYKLLFSKLPSSDTFLHTNVICSGAVVPFFLCILCKSLVIAKSPSILRFAACIFYFNVSWLQLHKLFSSGCFFLALSYSIYLLVLNLFSHCCILYWPNRKPSFTHVSSPTGFTKLWQDELLNIPTVSGCAYTEIPPPSSSFVLLQVGAVPAQPQSYEHVCCSLESKSSAAHQVAWHGKISESIHLRTENLCLSHGPGWSNIVLPQNAQAFVSPGVLSQPDSQM